MLNFLKTAAESIPTVLFGRVILFVATDGQPYYKDDAGVVHAMAGTDGKSAYQLWLDAGNTGTEAQFLASLKGADGAGVPAGGASNQVLRKTAAGDYLTGWVTLDAAFVGAQPVNDALTSLAGLTTAANQGIYTTAANTYATYTLSSGGRALGAASGASGTIPYFSSAATVGAIPSTTGGRALLNNSGTANSFPYYSAANTVALAAITAVGRSLAASTDAAAGRTTLGLGSAATADSTAFAPASTATITRSLLWIGA